MAPTSMRERYKALSKSQPAFGDLWDARNLFHTAVITTCILAHVVALASVSGRNWRAYWGVKPTGCVPRLRSVRLSRAR